MWNKKKKYLQKLKFFFSKNKRDVLLIILLFALSWYAWRMLPELVIRSDGFLHMNSDEQARFWVNSPKSWAGIELGASILGAILPNFFGVNISYYLWFELAILLIINVLFYIIVRIITKSSVIAFVSALIAGVSYFGSWDMFGTHCYCFFLLRIVNMILMFLSFIFLHWFLVSRKKIFFIISLLSFFIGLKLGNIVITILPLFILYPIFWFIVNTPTKTQIGKGIFFGTSFAIVSFFIYLMQLIPYGGWGGQGKFGPNWTFTEFLLNPGKHNYFEAIGLQLVFWLQYKPVLFNLFTPDVRGLWTIVDAKNSMLFVIVLYVVLFVYLYRVLPKFRVILLTCFFGTLSILYLNAYLKYYEITVPGANRYLYMPTFLFSIFWGITIWQLFLKRKRFILRSIGILILILYYFVNVALLENIFQETFIWDRPTKAVFSHIIEMRNRLSPNTLVVGPAKEFHYQEATFFSDQLGRGSVTYLTDDTTRYNWNSEAKKYDHVMKLIYNIECQCVIEEKIK